jgi:hypothetical protein
MKNLTTKIVLGILVVAAAIGASAYDFMAKDTIIPIENSVEFAKDTIIPIENSIEVAKDTIIPIENGIEKV